MKAKIYQPAKSAMSSGRGKTKHWVLEFTRETPMPVDYLMGWNGSLDTTRQIKMQFETKDEAIAHAEREKLDYTVKEPQERKIEGKAYAANFANDRKVGTTFQQNSASNAS